MIKLKDEGLLSNDDILDFIEVEKRKQQMEEQDMHAKFQKEHQHEPYFPQDEYNHETASILGKNECNVEKVKQGIVQIL